MSMQPLEFNFHNRLGFVLETDEARCARFFQSEFGFARAEVAPGLPVARLRWIKKAIQGEKGRGMVSTSHRLLARWRYDLEMSPGDIAIRVAGNALSIPMVHHMMVHPSLRILASEVDEILLHGAAVVFQGRSLVVTGEGGAGKTTTSTLLLAKGGAGWKLHADDYVFIGPGRKTHAYLTRSHLYKNMLRWSPDVGKRLTLWERIRLQGLGWLLALSGQRIKWPVRLAPSRLWPAKDTAQSAQLAAVVVLAKSRPDSARLRRISPDRVPIGHLLEMNFREAAHFERLAGRVRGLPDGWRREWRAREQAALERLRKGIAFYELSLPESGRSPGDLAGELVDLLGPLVKEG